MTLMATEKHTAKLQNMLNNNNNNNDNINPFQFNIIELIAY